MPLSWNAIFLGTGPDNDTNELTLTTESNFAGTTFGSVANPLSGRIHRFTVNDTNNDNVWGRDNNLLGSETATLNNGVTTQTVRLDSVIVYNATVNYGDGTTATITAVTFQLPDGRIYLAPETSANADNTVLNAKPIRSIRLDSVNNNNTNLTANREPGNFVPCLTAGVLVDTPFGPCPVEVLKPGDLVETRDNGPRRVIWTGSRSVPGHGSWTPIAFAPGAFGARRRTLVSPQHRILVSGWQAELLFGDDEVLAVAKSLVGAPGVTEAPCAEVTYVHILFDRHEIVSANGIACESFNPGAFCRDAVADATREELIALFPELEDAEGSLFPFARTALKPWEAKALVA